MYEVYARKMNWLLRLHAIVFSLESPSFLLRSIDHTLDDETAVLVLACFGDLERFQSICELERVGQEWLKVNKSPSD